MNMEVTKDKCIFRQIVDRLLHIYRRNEGGGFNEYEREICDTGSGDLHDIVFMYHHYAGGAGKH